jgi:hypothetical protein
MGNLFFCTYCQNRRSNQTNSIRTRNDFATTTTGVIGHRSAIAINCDVCGKRYTSESDPFHHCDTKNLQNNSHRSQYWSIPRNNYYH